jgi:hypothetical protein
MVAKATLSSFNLLLSRFEGPSPDWCWALGLFRNPTTEFPLSPENGWVSAGLPVIGTSPVTPLSFAYIGAGPQVSLGIWTVVRRLHGGAVRGRVCAVRLHGRRHGRRRPIRVFDGLRHYGLTDVKLHAGARALVLRQAVIAHFGCRQQHTLGRQLACQISLDLVAPLVGKGK